MNADENDLKRLKELQLDTLYYSSIVPIIVTLAGGFVLYYILLDVSNTIAAISWLTIFFIVSVIRIIVIRFYNISIKSPKRHDYWLNTFFAGVVCTGTLLGSLAYIFIIDQDIINIGLLTMFILVVASGSIGIYSVYQRIYYGFNIPMLLPLIIFLLIQNNEQFNKLSIILIAFTVCIFIIQYYAHRAINQLLMIKIENENLLDGYEVDQDRIKDLQNLNNSYTIQLIDKVSELRLCQEKLEQQQKH